MSAGERASCAPPPTPGCTVTIPALRSAPTMRRTTTGLVFTLAAMRSDVAASWRFHAR
jgi:hypothetical protein